MKNSPRILITNDDGIHSAGLYALWEVMQELGSVTVVAPDTEKSAVGHAITISDPIRIQEIERRNGFLGYAVDGTPADCVKIAVKALLEKTPDIIVSGINDGANVGTNIMYSGTVSAATEGTILNIPSLAISLDSITGGDYELSKRVAITIARTVLKRGLPRGTLINVNVPNRPLRDQKGYRITQQGNIYFRDHFEKREDPRGRFYYWMTGEVVDPDQDLELDGPALKSGYISVTPIRYQMTDRTFLDELQKWPLK